MFVLMFLGELYKGKVSPLWRHTFLVKYILAFRFSLALSSSSLSLSLLLSSSLLIFLISLTHGAHESVVSPRDQRFINRAPPKVMKALARGRDT